METHYIYLLQEREFIKTKENIYKIGRTKKPNYDRFKQYPKGSLLLSQNICHDCTSLERIIMTVFKEKFKQRPDIGKEYFQGNCYDMIFIIHEHIKMEHEIIRDNHKDNIEMLQINRKKQEKFADKSENKLDEKTFLEYKCVYCDITYLSEKIFKNHKKHCVDKYRCKLCDAKFSRKEYYNYHINRKKSCAIIGDHMCKYCDKAYSTDGSMRRHMIKCKMKEVNNIPTQKNNKFSVKERLCIQELRKKIEELEEKNNKNKILDEESYSDSETESS